MRVYTDRVFALLVAAWSVARCGEALARFACNRPLQVSDLLSTAAVVKSDIIFELMPYLSSWHTCRD